MMAFSAQTPYKLAAVQKEAQELTETGILEGQEGRCGYFLLRTRGLMGKF